LHLWVEQLYYCCKQIFSLTNIFSFRFSNKYYSCQYILFTNIRSIVKKWKMLNLHQKSLNDLIGNDCWSFNLPSFHTQSKKVTLSCCKGRRFKTKMFETKSCSFLNQKIYILVFPFLSVKDSWVPTTALQS
jgi:hypothetical protein